MMNTISPTTAGTPIAAFATENKGRQKLWKSEFTIEIPTGKTNDYTGMFKILALLCYSTGTFEIVPIKETDPILGHVSEYPKGDDTLGWQKYFFNSKRIRKHTREFDTVHVVINASQRLVGMKRNQRVWDTLTKDKVFIRARAYTNFSEKIAIGWFVGSNPAMSGKETLTKSIKDTLERNSTIIDTEIVLESTRIRQFAKEAKTVLHTEAWMLFGNKNYVEEIEECLHRYLSNDPHEVALGLRHCQFVSASQAKTEMPIKALRIKEQNRLLYNMVSVEINNVFYNDSITYSPDIPTLFDHYNEGELDRVKVTFRDLLDEQLQHFTDANETDETMEIAEFMDQMGGVYDIYFHRGNMHLSCHRDYASLVISGMKGVLSYLEENLGNDELAAFCKIRRLSSWNRPKVGAVHEYSETGIKRTTVDIYAPSDIDPISLNAFMEQEHLHHQPNATAYVPTSFDGPPKALYHGRKRAPVQTEIAHNKEGAAEFWSNLDIGNQSPRVSDVVKKLAKQKQTRKTSLASRTEPNVPKTITPETSQTSTGTSLTQMTDLHTKLKDQKSEFQDMIKAMQVTHDKAITQTTERIKLLEENINSFKQEQEEVMAELQETQGTMIKGISKIKRSMDKANASSSTQLDFLAEEAQLMREGQKFLSNGMQQILERLQSDPEPQQPSSPKRKGTIARRLTIDNTRLLNTLSGEPSDAIMADDESKEDFLTQDPNMSGQVGSPGC
jgi:hypothetical protein